MKRPRELSGIARHVGTRPLLWAARFHGFLVPDRLVQAQFQERALRRPSLFEGP
jgi:hypothetical protein